jgi:two-component system, chemotaxis family, response regulator Rcp1
MKKPGLNVLWVEDSADDIDLFTLAFQRAESPFHFEIKKDGQQALDYLMGIRHSPRERPNLILLDLNLPRRDGREVLAEIKKIDDIRTIPVIVLTTSNADRDIVMAYSLGAACYLVKPDGMPNLLKLAKSLSDFWHQVDVVRSE